MKKTVFVLAALMACSTMSDAQFLKNLGNAISGKSSSTTSSSSSSSSAKSAAQSTKPSAKKAAGPTYYVNANNGSNRADGLSISTAKKDLQKVLNVIAENNQDGAIINVAGGSYLGELDAGYIEIKNFVEIRGGWNDNFTERDPQKYVSRIQPTQEQNGTNGARYLFTINLDRESNGHHLLIDGFCLDLGLQNNYKPAVIDERNGYPSEKFETGRMCDNGSDCQNLTHGLVKGIIAGDFEFCNNMLLNSPNFGMLMQIRRGNWNIHDNVFVSNKMAAVRIDGYQKDGLDSYIDFHHNTVLFSWCRDKYQEDMGYGFEYMPRVNVDVHHCIFACNNFAALARTHADSNKEIEARRVDNAFDNLYFLNACDLLLPSKGANASWMHVKCKQFEDVPEEYIKNIDNNKTIADDDPFLKVFDQDYLYWFANNDCVSSSSFNASSAANQFRAATGQNMQGTSIMRVKMFGNRYNFDKALNFFGAKEGFGAQKLAK